MSDALILRLSELFEYKDGKLVRARQRGCAMVGDPVGTMNRKQLYVFVDSVRMRVDTCVWLLVYGVMPIGTLIHIDGDPKNCSHENLKDDGRPVRVANERPGISKLSRGVWQVDIKYKGVKYRVGTFEHEWDAKREYDAALTTLEAGGTLTKRPRRPKTGPKEE